MTCLCHRLQTSSENAKPAAVDAQTQKVKKRLRAISREIRAVEDGLKSVQAEAGPEDADAEPTDTTVRPSGQRQGDLQRATMLERLSALQAKQTQLQVTFAQLCHACRVMPWCPTYQNMDSNAMLTILYAPLLHACMPQLHASPSCLQASSLTILVLAKATTCNGCSVCSQAALDKQEGTAPSNSQPQSNQGVSDASNSESTAGLRKLKQKKRPPAPAAQLLEDEGLNAELDAANAGGLVETERDRLIRTVRQLSICKWV